MDTARITLEATPVPGPPVEGKLVATVYEDGMMEVESCTLTRVELSRLFDALLNYYDNSRTVDFNLKLYPGDEVRRNV